MMSGIGFIQSCETHTQFFFLVFVIQQNTKQANEHAKPPNFLVCLCSFRLARMKAHNIAL